MRRWPIPSGIFQDASTSLHGAQIEKFDRICRKLRLSEDDHVIEIGTGWGGFAIHAAQNYGCRVTTTTISEEQFSLAKERVERAGLIDRITLLKKDYRDLEGTFDKLVSIEMLEAVGHQFYAAFFKKCSVLLRPGGEAMIQTITIADQEYERAKNDVDFIKRYIFPGGCLPSITELCNTMTRSTGLRLKETKDFCQDYARTLLKWRHSFLANASKIRDLGYPPEFLRRWEYYLCYCEGAFAESAIGLSQLRIEKPAI